MTIDSRLNDSISIMKDSWTNIVKASVNTRTGMPVRLSYKYSKIIGRGTFGVVVEIQEEQCKEVYALKKVYQDSRYYNRELDILRMIDHVNIISLKYYYYENETDTGKYLNVITDYCPYDLETVIKTQPFTVDSMRVIVIQLLSALEYLHSKNICHRDIKPCNILLNKTHTIAKICDFGSAKIINKGSSNISYICSRYYRSPENLLEVDTYDTKIDIWSLGCVLVECHTQTPLFKGSSSKHMIDKILKICKCSDADLIELNYTCSGNRNAIGIKQYLSPLVQDDKLIQAYSRMLVINPRDRWAAQDIKTSLYHAK